MTVLVWLWLPGIIAGCFSSHRLKEIKGTPYPLSYEDDVTARFGDPEDDVFIEVRRAEMSRPLDNLAVHYGTLFPGGEVIRPGDSEDYVDIDGHKSYRVTYQTKYIRKRKRAPGATTDEGEVPSGWQAVNMPDPATGKSARVLYGPAIPRERTLYLVPGKSYVYYVFLRADGEAIESGRKKFEDFVRKAIAYR
jgi:hypothetical protein